MGGEGFVFDSIKRARENRAMKNKHGFSLTTGQRPYSKGRFKILQKKELSSQEKTRIRQKVRKEKRLQIFRLIIVVILALAVTLSLFYLLNRLLVV